MNTIICTKCNIEKEAVRKNYEWRNDQQKFRKTCRLCVKTQKAHYYVKNKCEIIKRVKKYRKDNIDSVRKYDRERGKLQKRKIAAAEYRNKNIHKIKKQKKEYYKDNSNEIKLKVSNYRKQNRYKINKYYRERRINDIFFRLSDNIRSIVKQAIRRSFGSKNRKSTLKFLPYSINELKTHLESQFKPWMNWNNWGRYNSAMWDDNDSSTWTWQIDHIIPQSYLPYDSMDHPNFQKCWALSNLRPLSAKQNIIDGVTLQRHIKG